MSVESFLCNKPQSVGQVERNIIQWLFELKDHVHCCYNVLAGTCFFGLNTLVIKNIVN